MTYVVLPQINDPYFAYRGTNWIKVFLTSTQNLLPISQEEHPPRKELSYLGFTILDRATREVVGVFPGARLVSWIDYKPFDPVYSDCIHLELPEKIYNWVLFNFEKPEVELEEGQQAIQTHEGVWVYGSEYQKVDMFFPQARLGERRDLSCSSSAVEEIDCSPEIHTCGVKKTTQENPLDEGISIDGSDSQKDDILFPQSQLKMKRDSCSSPSVQEVDYSPEIHTCGIKKTKQENPLDQFRLPFPEGTEVLLQVAKRVAQSKSFREISTEHQAQIKAINLEIKKSGIASHAKLVHINSEIGYGVFSTKFTPKNTVIGIYSGDFQISFREGNENSVFVYNIAENVKLLKAESLLKTGKNCSLEINADNKGNFTRFINHSSSNCNLKPVEVRLPNGLPAIMFLSTTEIQEGDQFLYNYGSDYWDFLGREPSDMHPHTYFLDSSGYIQQSNEFSAIKVRTLELNPFVKNLKSSIDKLSSEHAEQLKKWNDITKKNVSDYIEIDLSKRTTRISLKKEAQEGEFVGVLAGTITGSSFKGRRNILLSEEELMLLYLNLEKEGNCLSLLPLNDKVGNLYLQLLHNELTDELHCVLFAVKTIQPGEALSLRPFNELSF